MISDEVRSFIRSTISSVWALELLLYLRGHERAFGVAQLTRELRATPVIVERGLAVFSAAGLVAEETPGSYRYAPASERLDTLVRAVEAAYAKVPQAVSNEIYVPDSKIQDFADAFKFRKPEP
jgi:hypothetical protein